MRRRFLAALLPIAFLTACNSSTSSSMTPVRTTFAASTNRTANVQGDVSGGEHLYVINSENAIDIFAITGNTFRQIGVVQRDLHSPVGIATDAAGYVYVSNYPDNVNVYYRGFKGPSRIYNKDISEPFGVAVANDGTIYVANYVYPVPGWVSVYPKGDEKKEYRLSDFGGGAPLSIALDTAQNAYVLYKRYGSGRVKKYAPGATTGVSINLDFTYGNGIALDATGNIILSEEAVPSAIKIFAPGKVRPFKTIPLDYAPDCIALSGDGKTLFVSNPGGPGKDAVEALNYPAGTLAFTIPGVGGPQAVSPRP